MDQPLFRDEVMQARQSRRLGRIVLGQPLSFGLLTACAVACALVVVGFLVSGDYTRRTRVGGQLVPSLGMATVTAPASGLLSEVRVAEGQAVAEGDLLAVIVAPRATLAEGDTAQALQAAIAARQASIAQGTGSQHALLASQREGLESQREMLAAESAQLASELATRRAQQRIAGETARRFRRLRAQQYVTSLQLRQQEAAALEQAAAVQALERQALALRRQQAQVDQALAEIPARRAALEAAGDRDRAALSQESIEAASRAQVVVHAPVDGVVSTLLGQPGQAVQAGQPVLSVVPAGGTLEAHLMVPSRAVGFIAPGDAVLLRYQSFPYQKFGHHGGRVVRISRSALGGAELAALGRGSQGTEPLYRIVVALDRPTVRAFGVEEALKPGMLLDADILGERRALWEWAIEPLYSVTGRPP